MADLWDRKYQEFRGRCAYCGRDLFTDLDSYMASTHDHLIPKSKNGLDTEENLVLACAVCNTLKADFDPSSGSSSKEERIKRAREHIAKRRGEKMEEFWRYLKRYEKP